jgi:hypothetical protein
MPRETRGRSSENACLYQDALSLSRTKVRLIIIVNITSFNRYRLRLLLITTGNWDKGLSLGATALILAYLSMMSIQVCRKQISSEIALLADLTLVGPERYISEY